MRIILSKKTKTILPFFRALIIIFVFAAVITLMPSKKVPVLLHISNTVIIDPGHGGTDGGASGTDGTLEKDVNLQIALCLRDVLTINGYNVVMTRTDEYPDGYSGRFIKKKELGMRLDIANKHPNAIFISIHQNNFDQPQYSGFTSFYGKTEGSYELAGLIQKSVTGAMQPDNTRTIKKINGVYLFDRLKNVSVLLECGFLSNGGELEKLKDPVYQTQLSFCICNGITQFLSGE